ncbi:MAG: hypothetical protein OEY66_05115 [Gammaproteobacteria bacterium]|nr:hypothetical protein [Gammaproteobacteria bacterium]
MNKVNYFLFFCFIYFGINIANAVNSVDAYELIYEEREPGTDSYQVKFIVTEHYLRIDQLGDSSGYVVYDDNQHLVYSVAHNDKSVLVVPEYQYKKPDFTGAITVDYYIIPDAPTITGKSIYLYRATSSAVDKQKCLDIKLAEGLLPEVSNILMSYQKMLAGQQSHLLDATPKEYQSTCYLYDQVFNDGDYYHKGLPIQEWHSNGKSRLLLSYKKIKIDPEIFQLEQTYQKYSLD